MLLRRRGFTLIELLVVIAIIGILAAMLFPVFARARESARKTQCLSNVKNIALAVQMYLTDYDRFPPSDHNQQAISDFEQWIGSDRGCGSGPAYRATWGNPYLRWPVILDEYIKNRDVWRCPSAKWDPSQWWIIPDYGQGYLAYLAETHGSGWVSQGSSPGGSPCFWAFPTGWGGDVTDAIKQQAGAISPSNHPTMFSATIGCASTMLTDQSTGSINDPARCVVCGDGTQFGVVIQGADSLLYEECGLCGKADWVNCSWTANNACHTLDKNLVKQWDTDASYRNQFTRHMSGSNLGFADGHAKWIAADAVKADAPYCDNGTAVTQDKYEGLCP